MKKIIKDPRRIELVRYTNNELIRFIRLNRISLSMEKIILVLGEHKFVINVWDNNYSRIINKVFELLKFRETAAVYYTSRDGDIERLGFLIRGKSTTHKEKL